MLLTPCFLNPLQEMIVPNNVIDLPPPSPPKPKTIVLPPSWKVARDPEGKIYYYHVVTRLVLLSVCVYIFLCLCNSPVHISILCSLSARQANTVGPPNLGGEQ